MSNENKQNVNKQNVNEEFDFNFKNEFEDEINNNNTQIINNNSNNSNNSNICKVHWFISGTKNQKQKNA